MPIHEYRCRECGAEFEVLHKVSDPPLTTCRECEGPVDKLISRSAFQFKGTGWYVTDYADKNKKESDTSPKSGSSSGSSSDSSSGKTETKSTSGAKTATQSDAKPSAD